MERVAFLIEQTGTRLGCLLNPASLVTRRVAGLRRRRSLSGYLTGTHLADDPLLYTGGGRMELELDLLFDVTLAGSSISSEDVRDLTRPLWDLAENAPADDGWGRSPVIRFVWGKAWNLPCVVEAVAERLEYFTPEGAPRRSWLRMRLVRVAEPNTGPSAQEELEPQPPVQISPEELPSVPPSEDIGAHEVLASGAEDAEEPADSGEGEPAGSNQNGPGGGGERLDELAARYYGDPSLWRLLAAFNDVADPLRLEAGQVLRIPPASVVTRPT
jgi:hypothetical protein